MSLVGAEGIVDIDAMMIGLDGLFVLLRTFAFCIVLD